MDPKGSSDDDSVFHSGERYVQARLGVREKIEPAGRRIIRDHLIQQHIDFYPLLPLIFVGVPDPEGGAWAGALTGQPGFVHALDPLRLRVDALPAPDDPIARGLAIAGRVGLLGLEMHTRRRNRLNGRVVDLDGGGFTVAVQQSYGNCPKYIQTRSVRPRPHDGPPPAAVTKAGLDEAAVGIIRRADTFFIASVFGDDPCDARLGADMSHRGGPAGFVQLDGNRLTWPDYAGNNAFQTLGNITLEPRVGLLFVDFDLDGGTILQLSGRAEIVWDGPAVEAVTGAQRLVSVTVERMVRRPGVLPLMATFLEWSPTLP